jgi:hypothetical protein
VCRNVGLPMTRAATVNDDPLLLEMMADEVVKTWDRYRTGRPLVLSSEPGLLPEGCGDHVDGSNRQHCQR